MIHHTLSDDIAAVFVLLLAALLALLPVVLGLVALLLVKGVI